MVLRISLKNCSDFFLASWKNGTFSKVLSRIFISNGPSLFLFYKRTILIIENVIRSSRNMYFLCMNFYLSSGLIRKSWSFRFFDIFPSSLDYFPLFLLKLCCLSYRVSFWSNGMSMECLINIKFYNLFQFYH